MRSVLAGVAALLAASLLSVLPARAALVTTLAGSGAVGTADGAGAAASFLFPVAVATGPNGDVYVADAAAQRIRVVSSRGVVRTLAGGGDAISRDGWVTEGVRDGPASEARFATPIGIAVARDGTVEVADAAAGDVRRIAADGTVTTLARGLLAPHQLAFDRSGALYVADAKRGVVRVGADGATGDAGLGVRAPLGIAIFDDGHAAPTFFVSDEHGITVASGGRSVHVYAPRFMRPDAASVEGDADIGSAYALAALDARTVVYADPRADAIRMLRVVADAGEAGPGTGGAAPERVLAATWLIAGSAGPAESDGGGFADGTQARFDAPSGIALAPDGTLIVADAGNRRIRRIAGVERRFPLDDAGDVPLPPPRTGPRAYRIAYVGDSLVWWNTPWETSIPGVLERTLAPAVHAEAGMDVQVYPVRLFGARLAGLASYVETLADSRLVDAVVLQLGDDAIASDQFATSEWPVATASALGALRRHVAHDGVALSGGGAPLAIGVSPVEGTWRRLLESALRPALPDDEERWNAVFREAGIPSYDLWAAYRAEIDAPRHHAILTGDDRHPTVYGRALIAHTIAAALLRERPWRGRHVGN